MTRSEGMSSGSPSSTGGWPVAKTTAPGWMSPAEVSTATQPVAADGDPGRGDPGGHRGQRRRPAWPRARSGLTRAWWRISAPSMDRARPGMSCSTWPGASHSTAGGWCGAKPPGCGARPIQSISTSPTPPGQVCSSSRHRSRLARSRSNERLRVAPLVGLRDQQAGRTAGRAGAQAAGLDQQHRAEAGLVAGGGGGDADDPAADHQQVRARLGDAARRRGPGRALRGGELITPDSSLHEHDPSPISR